MSKADKGMTVKVHYTGTLADGTVFDSSREREPMEFTLGQGRLIKGFENAVMGLEVGKSTKVDIPCVEAYGEHRKELVIEFDKAKFPPSITPEVGQYLNLRQPDGGVLDVMIMKVEGDKVTLDANHPLAGKDLTFDIELVAIV